MNRILSIERLDRYGRPVESARESASGSGGADRGSGASRVRVTPEEGEAFTISGRRAARLGLAEGEDLSDQLREEIMQTLRASCMQRCGMLLGSRDYPVRRLRAKLTEAGYPPSIVEECIEKLSQAHYLDDRRYAENYVRSRLQDRSLMRIRQDLAERGIPEEYVEEALARIGEEADPREAQLAQIRRLLRKRGYDPSLAEEDYALRLKTMAFLHRRGYPQDLIRRAMEEPDPAGADSP